MYSNNEINEFIALRTQGLSYSNISTKLNIPVKTLYRWNQENTEEISLLKEAALEDILNTLKVSAFHRVSSLANDLNKIDSELRKYSYDSFRPEDLLKMKMKILSELSKFDSLAPVDCNIPSDVPKLDDISKLKSRHPKIDYLQGLKELKEDIEFNK